MLVEFIAQIVAVRCAKVWRVLRSRVVKEQKKYQSYYMCLHKRLFWGIKNELCPSVLAFSCGRVSLSPDKKGPKFAMPIYMTRVMSCYVRIFLIIRQTKKKKRDFVLVARKMQQN